MAWKSSRGQQIPTGQIAPVKGTPFNCTSPTAIGAHITANDPQLLLAHGYDHNWVINMNMRGVRLPASHPRAAGG